MSWKPEYEPLDSDDVNRMVQKYGILIEEGEEVDIPCWVAHYNYGITGMGGSSHYYALTSKDSKKRSLYAAALMCFLWYEKHLQYPLCRDLARKFFQD